MASAVVDLASITSGNERFNVEAAAWDSRPFVHEASKQAATAILEGLSQHSGSSRDKQVLEIGCGTGILSVLLAPHVQRVVAVDAAQGMIDVLRQKLTKPDAPKNILPLALLLTDPEDESLPAGNDGLARQKFDLITSHLVLHHIPDLEAVLRTMLGCLAPGGCVMLTDFEDFGPAAKRFHPASKMGGVARHGINADRMELLMRENGFQNVNVKAAWTMSKTVKKTDGEFGASGAPHPGTGTTMEFPFVLCYGGKAL